VGNAITSQFIRYNLPWFTFVFLQQSPKESLSSLRISSVLKKHINDFTILIYCPPEITLFAINFDENLINEKCVAISLMFSTQPGSVFGSELVAPQSN
jgi:hypothetical protein